MLDDEHLYKKLRAKLSLYQNVEMSSVVYFDQRLGTPHSIPLLKYAFWMFLMPKAEKRKKKKKNWSTDDNAESIIRHCVEQQPDEEKK